PRCPQRVAGDCRMKAARGVAAGLILPEVLAKAYAIRKPQSSRGGPSLRSDRRRAGLPFASLRLVLLFGLVAAPASDEKDPPDAGPDHQRRAVSDLHQRGRPPSQ